MSAQTTVADRSRQRERRVFLSVISALGAKGTSALSLLIITPLALDVLGGERFGIWLTLTSLGVALSFLDFGLGNGLLSVVSHAHGEDDEKTVASAFTNAFLILASVALIVIVAYYLVLPYVDLKGLYGLAESSNLTEVRDGMTVVIVLLAISLPLQMTQKVQQGYQEGLQSNIWQVGSNILTLLTMIIVANIHPSVVTLLIAALGVPIIVHIMNLMHQITRVRPWLRVQPKRIEWNAAVSLLKLGGIWTASQLATLIGMGLDSFIVSKNFGASAVGEYAVMARLQTLLLMSQILALPLWPAFSEALARGDRQWAQRTFHRTVVVFGVIGILSAGVIFFGAQSLISIWVSPSVKPDFLLVVGFACWAFIANFFFAISALLVNRQTMKVFTCMTGFASIVSLVLKFLLMDYFEVSAVVFGSVVGYGLICLPGYMLARRKLDAI